MKNNPSSPSSITDSSTTSATEPKACCGGTVCSSSKLGVSKAEAASRMIIALVCFTASYLIAVVPNVLSASVTDFQKGVLTAAFIAMGLVVVASTRQKREAAGKAEKSEKA